MSKSYERDCLTPMSDVPTKAHIEALDNGVSPIKPRN